MLVSSDHNLLPYAQSLPCAFLQTPDVLSHDFFSGVATPIKPRLVKCCGDYRSSGRFSHLSQGTLLFCQSGHWVFGHLADQAPPCTVSQFGRKASSWQSLGSSIFFPISKWRPLKLSTLNCFIPFLKYASSQLYLEYVWTWYSFCSDMHCQMWDLK
jgi:hypothetical protein